MKYRNYMSVKVLVLMECEPKVSFTVMSQFSKAHTGS
jgi:hypothetical protein